MKDKVKQEADEILKAEAEAEKMLEDSRLKVRGFKQDVRDAEQLAAEARAQLTAFLESLLAEIDPHRAGVGSAVDELLARAGEAAKADPREGSGDQPEALADANRRTGRDLKVSEPQEDPGG